MDSDNPFAPPETPPESRDSADPVTSSEPVDAIDAVENFAFGCLMLPLALMFGVLASSLVFGPMRSVISGLPASDLIAVSGALIMGGISSIGFLIFSTSRLRAMKRHDRISRSQVSRTDSKSVP